jgi:hypothetical protein
MRSASREPAIGVIIAEDAMADPMDPAAMATRLRSSAKALRSTAKHVRRQWPGPQGDPSRHYVEDGAATNLHGPFGNVIGRCSTSIRSSESGTCTIFSTNLYNSAPHGSRPNGMGNQTIDRDCFARDGARDHGPDRLERLAADDEALAKALEDQAAFALGRAFKDHLDRLCDRACAVAHGIGSRRICVRAPGPGQVSFEVWLQTGLDAFSMKPSPMPSTLPEGSGVVVLRRLIPSQNLLIVTSLRKDRLATFDPVEALRILADTNDIDIEHD